MHRVDRARRNRIRAWLATLSAALLLAGLAGSGLASATPARDASLRSWMDVSLAGVKRTICVGDHVALRVVVWKGTGRWGAMRQLAGVPVSASASGGAGTVAPTSIVTSLGAGSNATFTAAKAGTADITFTGAVQSAEFLGYQVSGSTVRSVVRLTVEDCKYRLTATSRWRIPGAAQLAVLARVEMAGVVLVDGKYTGTGRVQWIVNAGTVGTCDGTLPPESQVTVTGFPAARGAKERITWDLEYGIAPLKISIDCRGAAGVINVQMQPDPLTEILPVAGGAKSGGQVLRLPSGDQGSFVLVVKQEQAR
jgi:hypothetical protein